MPRFEPVSTSVVRERAIIIGLDRHDAAWPVEQSLDELARLADTADAEVVGRLTQRLERPIPKSYMGSGKVVELKGFVDRLNAQVVIADDDLSPSQQLYLEKALGGSCKIIDRTALILDIFGRHARTREGYLQVQLAQLQYLLPRLRGMWSHLAKEQSRGGIGSRFGQGETQLEIDRRIIRNRIATLRRELLELEKRRDVQSKSRTASPAFRIALAGYTNAGKSTLLNRLTGSDVLSEDKLFATLDPTTRAYQLPGGRTVTITDTVGFIQKLPHGLVESFKSTLSEVRNADLILKVVDASDVNADRHIAAVESVLREIGAHDLPTLVVYNKVDLLEDHRLAELLENHPDAVGFSALTGAGLDPLLDRLECEAAAQDTSVTCALPYSEGALLSLIRAQGRVISEDFQPDAIRLVCTIPARLESALEPFRTE